MVRGLTYGSKVFWSRMIECISIVPGRRHLGPSISSFRTQLPQAFRSAGITREAASHANDGNWLCLMCGRHDDDSSVEMNSERAE